ncbi:MAG TPA: hypothetical protein VHM01_21580 [Alphaproteobacteria bacterium]|nr:hypothetical protein [Alphaproteobacteria bacterium]
MTDSCILIDDLGRVLPWPEECRRFDAAYRQPDFDFPAYAVRNLGFITVAERKGFLRIRLRPAFCGHRTSMALLSFVAQRTPARAAISRFSGCWHDELCSGGALQHRLSEILSVAALAADDGPFIAVPRRVSGLLRESGNPFAPLLRRWLDQVQPHEIRAFLVESRLYDRAMIVERLPDSGHFVFRHSGQRIQLYPAAWAQSAIGQPLQDQPDQAYGQWIAEACRQVDDRQVPRFELITARVAQAGATPRQWRYERLMLPWRDTSGRRLVVSVSLRDQARSRFG